MRDKILRAVVAVPLLVFIPAGVAAAAADADTPIGPDTSADSLFALDAYTVTLILGLVIPLINGLLTTTNTSTKLKVAITMFLSAVAGVVNVSLTEGGGAVVSQDTVKSAALTFLVAVVAYLGIFKPVGLTSSNVTSSDASGNLVAVPGKLADVGVK